MNLSISDSHKNLLNKIALREGFQNYDITFSQGSLKGDGYMGDIVFAKIQEKSCDKSLNLVLKSAHEGEHLRDNVPIQQAYSRENFIYSTVFKVFKDLQEEFGVKEKFDGTAVYYGGLTDSNEECVVLENLREKSFTLWDRKTPMNPEHVEAVMKQYGKFHALSYALKILKPEVFKEKTKNLDNFMQKYFSPEETYNWLFSILEKVYGIMGADRDIKMELKNFEKLAKDFNSIKYFDTDKNSVILHADCWCNNFMFKYEDTTKRKPCKVYMLDWQLSNFGSPFRDLAYFFYTCSPEECLKNYVSYLEIYYNSMNGMLRQFNLKVEDIMTFEDVLNEWKNFAWTGLITCLFLFKVMLSEQTEITEIKEMKSDENLLQVFDRDISNADEYNRRAWIVIRHMVDNGFI